MKLTVRSFLLVAIVLLCPLWAVAASQLLHPVFGAMRWGWCMPIVMTAFVILCVGLRFERLHHRREQQRKDA